MKNTTAALLTMLWLTNPSAAWDANGHRIVTLLALEGLSQRQAAAAEPDRPPAWLLDAHTRAMIADQATVPDRWRSTKVSQLTHQNNPDHYIDLEDLAQFGLTFRTVSPFRYEYLRDMAIAKHAHPENMDPDNPPYNPKSDPARTQEWPGFLPHAILEHYGKLVIAFRTIRTLEASAGPNSGSNPDFRRAQIDMAKANALVEMGLLSHFVGDAAQPLHTTRHHHGWVGRNPEGYTTERGIHAYIDGTVLSLHKLDFAALRPSLRTDATAAPNDPWGDVLTYIERSHERVAPLYQLRKSGDLDREPGKAFITERLTDAGDMLGALYAAAWNSSKPRDADLAEFQKYDGTAGAKQPAAARQPVEQRP